MAERGDGVVLTEEMLIGAAKTGNHESLAVWAKQGVRVTSTVPLFLAARGRHLLALQCLVREVGANVNQTFQGETPLMSAAYERNPTVVRCLLELGADVNQASGKTIYANGRTALHTAAHIGGFASVRYLIQAGAKSGAVDSTGETASLESAQGGHYAAMRYLLEEADANMDDIDNFGETAWGLLKALGKDGR
jgi:ankyrin repeat protein